jgi:hypothetical protein
MFVLPHVEPMPLTLILMQSAPVLTLPLALVLAPPASAPTGSIHPHASSEFVHPHASAGFVRPHASLGVFLVRACGDPESEFEHLWRGWEALAWELMWLQCEQLEACSHWLDKELCMPGTEWWQE